ncbi:MAG TPA: hypothetical protein EYP59_20200 [Thiotrichaceae bacterium]|nr:hypothetical protein [Thiotrichaceae bacterium]
MTIFRKYFLIEALIATSLMLTFPLTWAYDLYTPDIARITPQIIAAGVSPSQIDWFDGELDVVAVVRPGRSAIRSVTFQDTGGALRMMMQEAGVLPNGDEVYKSTYVFTPGSFGEETLPTAWGPRDGQFNIIATGEAKRPEDRTHRFPYLRVSNLGPINHLSRPGIPKQAAPMNYNSIQRYGPQVIMAGYSPSILHVGDDQVDLIAIVRRGAFPIATVTFKQNSGGGFAYKMQFAGQLSNGDELYKTTYAFDPGSLGKPGKDTYLDHKDLWGPKAQQFGVVAIDEGGMNSHKFPNIEFGTYPAYP